MNEPTSPAAARRDIVVIGAAAGGIVALHELLGALPATLAAAIFVTVHASAREHRPLDVILGEAAPLAVGLARENDLIEHGRVYVAPPRLHLLVGDTSVRLSAASPEHARRPAIDPMFRSAAVGHGGRVIGVVLTGWLDDGAAGLVAIKQCGGVALVQDPADAVIADMPERAIAALGDQVDGVLPIAALARRIVELVNEPAAPSPRVPDKLLIEVGLLDATNGGRALERIATPSPMHCPDCGEPLWQIHDRHMDRYRCHEGHGFSARTLSAELGLRIDRTISSAARLLEERAEALARLARRSRRERLAAAARSFSRERDEARSQADMFRKILFRRGSPVAANENGPSTIPPGPVRHLPPSVV